MERSISHTLLVDNKIYLQAVQHKRISLENLGLHEVQYSFGSTRNTTGRRVLKAVIPENNQIEFLQKVGLAESPARPSSATKVKEPVGKPRIRKKRNHDEEHDHRHKKNHLKSKSEKTRPKSADPLSGTHLVRRTSIGGTPLYTKPSQTFISILEREREEAIARTKAKEHAAKLGVNFDMVDREGVKYVYDNRGVKVTEEEYQKQLDDAERAKKRRSEDRIIPPHKTALIEKTKRFVEDLRKRIESETILDFRWYPGKFPATTLPPRPGSANGPNSNSLRDISTLGKSLSTPFRKGEPHVLPSNLVRQWPEYRVMEAGDVVLTVEHCCQCHEHDMCTHHKEEQYLQMAESVRENLAATAKKYAVRFYSVCKPVEFQDPLSKSLSHSERIVSGQSSHQQPKSGDNAAFNIDYSQRLGAFEVQVAVRTKKDFICHLLFSKLFKGNWPKMSTLQSLLERVLTEAKFFQLVKDPPRSPSRPTSRPGSPKREPLYKPPKKDNKVPEIHAEFDLRLPAADTDEEEPVEEEAEEEDETGEYEEDTYSLPPPLSRESSTRLLTIPENSDIDTGPKLGSPISASRGSTKSTKSPKGKSTSAKYSAEENAAASALTRFMRASKPNESAPSSKRNSFSSEYSEDETSSGTASPIRSTKAKLLALGSASAGLQYVRRKSKNLDQAEGAGLISYEEAMAIANGTSSAEKPRMYTKKQSAIGILSRQNAGAGGQGRYLVVEDEDESPMPSDQPVRAFFPSPIQIQKTNSQTSIPFVTQPSPREHAALPLSPKRSTPHKKSSFSTVSEDEEVIGFSPMNSQKGSISGLRPVALAVEVTQAGMAFAKNRSSSVTSMPQTPTMVEMLHERQSTGKLSQSERIPGRPSPATRNPHNTHPSLEMRTKLNIGTLSRQNAGIRGESLVVADSDSDDESRPGDRPESVPSQRILDAMASAVSAVSLADTLTNTNAGTSTASSSTNTLALTGGSVVTPHSTPVVATATTAAPASSSLADRRPSNITAIDTSHSAARRSRTEPKKDAPAPEVSVTSAPAAAPTVAAKAPQPTTAAPAVVPVIAAPTPVVSTPIPTVVPTVAVPVPTVPAAVMTPMPSTTGSTTAGPIPVVSSTPVASLHTDKAATTPPVSEPASSEPEPEPAPVLTPVPARVVSAFAVQDNGTHMGRRMSSAEVLQMKRGLADQLVLTVSRDILEPVPSEYADDFDDFENFSPSMKKAGNGLDDLFEASDFKLDDEL